MIHHTWQFKRDELMNKVFIVKIWLSFLIRCCVVDHFKIYTVYPVIHARGFSFVLWWLTENQKCAFDEHFITFAPQFGIMSTSIAANDGNFVEMATFPFQGLYVSYWIHATYLPIYVRAASLALGQSYNWPSFSQVNQKYMAKFVTTETE